MVLEKSYLEENILEKWYGWLRGGEFIGNKNTGKKPLGKTESGFLPVIIQVEVCTRMIPF